MFAKITAISYHLPTNILTNEEINTFSPLLIPAEIFKRTGIKKRHITGSDEVGSDLGFYAGDKLFKEHNINRNKIDFLLFCTEGLDYKAPTTACVLHERLNLQKACGAMDIPNGCAGYLYGLSIAKALINSGQATSVLLITSDIPSTVIHPEDLDMRMLFGDAGAATLIESTKDEEHILNFVFGTDGKGAENLMVKSSGVRGVLDENWLEKYKNVGGMKFGRMQMDSVEIFSFALRVVPTLIKDTLEKNQLTLDKIDLFIFHQANAFMLKVLRRKLKIDEDKFFEYIENVGNTVSASIPIALYEAIKIGKAKKGQTILLAGFGIGYSWSATVIRL